MLGISNRTGEVSEQGQTRFRKSSQPVMPYQTAGTNIPAGYNMYPFHSLGNGKIFNGYDSLAKWMSNYPFVVVDGFSGVLWNDVQNCLEEAFGKLGLKAHITLASHFLKDEHEINEM